MRKIDDPAWQIVGIIISVLSFVVTFFSLPDSIKPISLFVAFIGFIVCFVIIRRPAGVNQANPSVTASRFPPVSPYSPQPIAGISRRIPSSLSGSLLVNAILIVIDSMILPTAADQNNFLISTIYLLLVLSMVAMYIDLFRRIFVLTRNKVIENRFVFECSSAAVILSVIIGIVLVNTVPAGAISNIDAIIFLESFGLLIMSSMIGVIKMLRRTNNLPHPPFNAGSPGSSWQQPPQRPPYYIP